MYWIPRNSGKFSIGKGATDMELWYVLWDSLPFEMLHWKFMQHALLAILLMAPLFGHGGADIMSLRIQKYCQSMD